MRVELLIFDCDGVLVDSEPIANRVFTEALAEIGLPLSYEEVCDRFIGLTMTRCLEIVEERMGRPAPVRFLDELRERTFDAFRRELRPVRGVTAALATIDAPICVASSGEPEKIRLSLGLTGLLNRFEGRIFSATEVEHGKPAPDLFLHAAASLGADPLRCVVIEDSPPGVRAGIAAGMTVLGFVEDGNGSCLAENGATVFYDMRELPRILAPLLG